MRLGPGTLYGSLKRMVDGGLVEEVEGSESLPDEQPDGARLLVSSANLTEFALNMNMELGLLVRGEDLPNRVVEHLNQLIQERVLVPLQ